MSDSVEIAKSANRIHVKRRSRDAAIIQSFERAAKDGFLEPDIEIVVIRDELQRLTAAKAKARTKPSPRLSDDVYPTKHAHHACPRWQDTHEFLKAYFAHNVLKLDGSLKAFTLNLGGDVEEKVLADDKKASRWLSQRLNHHLEAALGRKVDYWFRIELGDGRKPYPHLHGELACSDGELKAAREALKKAGGEWAGAGNKQLKTSDSPDTGWISYAMKLDLVELKKKAVRKAGAPHESSWRDHRFFISQSLSRRAKQLYEDLRPKLKFKTTSFRKAREFEL